MNIYIPAACGAVKVALILEDAYNRPYREVAFSHCRDEEAYEVWQCSFTLEQGLYYYWFRISKDCGGFRLFRQGRDTNMEAGDKWQLSCVPADFTVPDYARGAVMYQIMPDRFCRSGRYDLTDKLRPFQIHKEWNETPNYFPDGEGNWNNDFFGGTLRGIREKLPYLQDLGVRILYLNPIFMAFSNHRYDTADYKRIDPMLGTEADFRELCAAAHEKGMYVILDGVFSHTGNHSIYFDANHTFGGGAVSDPDSPYREWYRFYHYPDNYESWWGIPTLPCVDELTESYLHYIIEDEDSVVAHWMKLGADGFRLDVVDELPDQFVLQLKRRMRSIRKDSFLIGEVWEDASNKRAYGISRRYFVDGELDSVMNYPWRTGILNYVRGCDDGSALGECVMTLAENYPPQVLNCVMNILGTHDTPRVLTVLGDSFDGTKAEKAGRFLSPQDRRRAVNRLRMAAFLEFMLPGMASIYYADEAGMEGFEDPFCRRCFPWNHIDEDLHTYYRQLAHTKNTLDTLRYGDIRVTEAGRGRLAFTRTWQGETSYIYVNLSPNVWQLPPEGTLLFGRGFCYDGASSALEPGGFCLRHCKNNPKGEKQMKFSQYPYERPDAEALKAQIDACTRTIRSAATAEEQIQAADAMVARMESAESMGALAYIRSSINTKDPFYDAERTFFDEVGPELEEKTTALYSALLDSPFRAQLEEHYGSVFMQNLEIARRSFSPELIPLMQEESKLEARYQKLYAAMTVEMDGKSLPVPMLGKYKGSTDRAVRRAAFEAEGKAFDAHQEELDEIFDKLVKNRNAQGRLLGYENYLQLGYDRLGRNCYGGKELESFRRQIAEDLVPIIAEVKESQRRRIGVDQLCIYDDNFRFADGNADPTGTAGEILAAGKRMYQEMSPETKEFIEFMFDSDLFDVLSHEGKAPGGYCSTITAYKAPFIFSNFNGTSDDVDVLTHEAGHAFAAYRALRNPTIHPLLLSPTMEACECHSMSMEFLTQDYHKYFFGENTAKYELAHCEESLDFIPYGCMIDEFQHRMYENENLTPLERNKVWEDLEKRYRPWLSMDGLPFYGRYSHWQWKLHVYLNPLYYIDYCMAQTVAYQIWTLSLRDREAAWKKYLAFVDMAGTKTFADLCRSADLRVPYEEGVIRQIGGEIRDWLGKNAL